MRRHIYQGFARAALLGDETDLANFLTYGFAELDVPGPADAGRTWCWRCSRC